MTKRSRSSCRLVLAVSLTVSVVANSLCGVARADDLNAGKSLRIPVAAFAPIGKVYSLGAISINGRRVYGEEMIFGGEQLQVSGDSRACVRLDSIGQVTLARGASAKLAKTATNLDDIRAHYLLVATITSGDIVVKLEQDAGAYIEACGLVLTSSLGASFRIEIRDGQPMIDTTSGVVKMEPQEPRVEGRDFKVLPDGRIVKAVKGPLTVKPKKAKSADGQFIRNYLGKPNSRSSSVPQFTLISYPTTQVEEGVANRMVHFEVVPSSRGTVAPTRTKENGVFEYTFVAGSDKGSGQIIGTIDRDPNQDPPGTIYVPYTRKFVIPGFWTKRNKLLTAAAAAAAIICIGFCGPGTKPLRQEPPPIIP